MGALGSWAVYTHRSSARCLLQSLPAQYRAPEPKEGDEEATEARAAPAEEPARGLKSDLAYKEYQYNTSMPCDEGMDDPSVALLIGHGLRRDRDALEARIAEKRLELYDADTQSGQQAA
jgi:hypothetical protein